MTPQIGKILRRADARIKDDTEKVRITQVINRSTPGRYCNELRCLAVVGGIIYDNIISRGQVWI
jgi:hypothetical protein